MNKYLRNSIIILLILLVTIISILLVILIKNKDELSSQEIITGEVEEGENAYKFETNEIKTVKLRNDFFMVKSCVETFYNNYLYYITSGNNPEKVYNLLDSEYIEMFGITENNLKNKFGNYNDIRVDITNMYSVQLDIGKYIYFVYGNLLDAKSSNITDLYIGVKVNNTNRVFSILPYEYLEAKQYLNINENTEKEFKWTKEIENKTYNTCKSSYMNDETYIEKLFENYIDRALYNIELGYKTLDEEYKKNKFSNIQKYKEYIAKNKELYMSYDMKNAKGPTEFENMDEFLRYLNNFQKIKLESYKVTQEDGYDCYIGIDNLDNYYIFKETAPMQYTIILDNYTVDLPEFINTYNAANDKEKVGTNIEKILEAINQQDYEYVYKKLNNTFKNNYFSNIDSFKQYINTKFYNESDIEYNSYKQEGDVYIYNVTVKDIKNPNNKNTLNILVRLKKGTDFEISFGM